MYSFHFHFEANSRDGVKEINLTLAQIFEDERVDFNCFYEIKEGSFLFFGLHNSENVDIMINDAALMDDLSMYVHLCEEGVVEISESDIDERIKKYSFEEFMNSLDPEEYYTPEESEQFSDMMYDASFFNQLSDEDIEQEEENGEEEIVGKSSESSVMIDPNLIMNMSEEAISDMSEHVLSEIDDGKSAYVMDGNSLEDMFMQMFEDPEFLQQEMKPMLKERLVRKL